VWTTLDLDGQQLNQSEYPIVPTENQKTSVPFNLILEETDDKAIKIQLVLKRNLNNNSAIKYTDRITVLFNKDGKQINDCQKSSSQHFRALRSTKTILSSPVEAFTCFIKHGKRITDYITAQKWEASYDMISDNEHHILFASMANRKVLELTYFKD
jgi:hypothetical protein